MINVKVQTIALSVKKNMVKMELIVIVVKLIFVKYVKTSIVSVKNVR